MTLASPKGSPKMAAFPRSLSSIAASVVVLAAFLIFASWLLVSFPIGSTVRGYFYGVDRISSSGSYLELPMASSNSSVVGNNQSAQAIIRSSVSKDSLPLESNEELPASPKDSVDSKNKEMPEKPVELSDSSSRATEKNMDNSSLTSGNASKSTSVDSGCDLYHGNWFYDPQGPTYTNNTCPS